MSGGGKEALYPLWKYVDRVRGPKGSGGSAEVTCKLCPLKWKGSYTRVKAHFLHISGVGVDPCTNEVERYDLIREQERAEGKVAKKSSHASTTGHVRSQHGDSEVDVSTIDVAAKHARKRQHTGSSNPIEELFDVIGQDVVDAAIARFFYANGIAFNVSRSPFYTEMVQAILHAPTGYKPPGYEKLRTTLLDKEKSRLDEQTTPLKRVWVTEGCSIVMDGWTDARNRPLLNIMVTCSKGPYFLKAIDCSGQEKNAEFLHTQLCEGIEEVGATHVVQVVTDAAPVCKAAGMLVQKKYKHIFWTPCCVHSLNNALKDIGKFQWITDLIEKGRKIQMFICNHHHTQAIYRKFAKVELLKPADTRFASYFILLDRLCEVKGALCSTVVSEAWTTWRQSTSDTAVEVRGMILDEHFWADVKFVVEFIKPICELIRFADSDKACLGEIYEAIDSMCEKVKTITDIKDPSLYPLIEEKLHGRWNKLNTPLHCAAYALNPKWHDIQVTGKRAPHQDREVMKGFWAAIKKIYGRGEDAAIIRSQWNKFSRGKGKFGSVEALYDMKLKIDPIEWWWNHGGEASELQSFAIRLLSQVASSSSCERNWSTYGFIHSLLRNRLGSKKAEKLVYIHSSLRLLSRLDPGYNDGPSSKWDQISPDGELAALVDGEVEVDGLIDLPIIILPTKEPELESDDYLDSIITEDLDMDDEDIED